jgi:hypothetical protein
VDATQARIIVVAGALVPPGWLALAAVSDRLPRLARLGVHAEPVTLPPEPRALPSELAHDRWLRHRLAAQQIPPGAMAAVRRLARHGDGFTGWLVEPAHLHLGRDHVVLAAGAMRELTEAEAAELSNAIAPILAEDDLEMTVLDPRTWLLRERRPAGNGSGMRLQAASADAAAGRSIAGYLPEGPDARRYRRLLTGIQMTWHEHPVNVAREARGALAVNGIWLSGPVSPQALAAWRAQLDDGEASLDETLLEPRLQDDRDAWLEALAALESRLLPVLQARTGQAVLLCGEEEARWLRTGSPGMAARAGAMARRVAGSLRSLLGRGRSTVPPSSRGVPAEAAARFSAGVHGRATAADPLVAVFTESGRSAYA